jgi:hypothetical protein
MRSERGLREPTACIIAPASATSAVPPEFSGTAARRGAPGLTRLIVLLAVSVTKPEVPIGALTAIGAFT